MTQILGLTQNETKTYESLLKLGKTTASHISKESGVPYGRIYVVLASLETKGLVRVVPEETKKYAPTNPDAIKLFLSNARKNIDEMEKKIKEYDTIYSSHQIEPVQIVKGKNTFYKLMRSLKKAEHYKYDIKYSFEFNPEFVRDAKEELRTKVKRKSIGRINEETKKNVKQWTQIDKIILPIDNDGVAMSIIDDEQIMISLIKSNTTMLITDKSFAKVIRQLFDGYVEYEKKIRQQKKSRK